MAVPVRRELQLQNADLERRLLAAAGRMVEERRTQVEGLGRGLVDPRRLLEEMTQRLDERAERLKTAWEGLMKDCRARLGRLEAALPHPRQLVVVKGEQLAAAGGRLETVRPRLLTERQNALEGLGRVLESMSYKKVLQRGYAVVRGPEGAITDPDAVTPGLALELEFAAGRATATGGAGTGAAAAAGKVSGKPPAKVKKKTPPSDDSQGSLL